MNRRGTGTSRHMMKHGKTIVVLMSVSSSWSRMVAEYLAGAGHRVHVLDFNATGLAANVRDEAIVSFTQNVESVRCVAVGGSFPRRLITGVRTLRRAVREHDAKMVLTLYGGMQAAIAWLSGVRPYEVYVVGSDVLLANCVRRLLARFTLHGARGVWANGRHLYAATRHLAPKARVREQYLGINLRRYRPGPGLAPAPRFVCTRYFAAVYDNGTIIRAIGILDHIPPNFEMLFLSSGPHLGASIAMADDLLDPDVRSRVHFAGGVSDDQLIASLQSASFYISASHSDGASASLLEAMACGVFPIVTDIPANREWIRDHENGLLFAPGDYRALAGALGAALECSSWMASAVRANYKLVAERGNVELNLERLSQRIGRQGGSQADWESAQCSR